MTDVERRLEKARESLAFARHVLAGDFAAEAGRAAYMAFLGRAYELKAFADYDHSQPVTSAGAEDAINEAALFVELIAVQLRAD